MVSVRVILGRFCFYWCLLFYILMLNNSTEAMLVFHMYSNLYLLVGYTQEDGVIVWCVTLVSVGITPLYIS